MYSEKKGMNVMMLNTSELILDAVILSIVASTPEGISGFKIVQNVRSKIDVPENTFYPLLKQMQADGYLEVYHKDIGGRSRRFYKITDPGRAHLVECQQSWNNYLQGASSLLMNPSAAMASDESVASVEEGAAEPVAAPIAEEVPEVAPQMEAPVPEVPVMEVTPQMAAPVQEVPVMEVAPQMEVPVQEVPVMEVAPQMAAPVQEVPVMEVAPQMEAPVPDVPVMEATPQMAAPVQEAPVEDTYHIGNGTNMVPEFDFSIGEDDSVTSDDMGFSSSDDLFEFDTIPAASFISYDDGAAEPVPEAAPVPVVYEEPAADVAPVVYEEPAIAPAAPVYQEPVAEAVPAYSEMPVPEEVPVVYEEPVEEAAPVYEEPAIANVTPVAPVIQEPVAQIQPEQLAAPQDAVDAPVDIPVMEAPVPEVPQDMVSSEAAPEEDIVFAASVEDDDEADFLAEMAMGDEDEEMAMEEETPAEESSMSDLATINELESMLTQLRSFESVMKNRPEQNVPDAVQNTTADSINITNLEAVSSFLDTAIEQPQQEAPAPTPTATGSSHVSSAPTSSPVRYTEVRNQDTDDSVNSLVDLLKDDGQPKKRGFFSGFGKKKNIPKEIMPDRDMTAGRTPTPAPSRPAPTPAPAPAPRQMREVRSPETEDSVDSLVDLLKGNDSGSKKSRGWGKAPSGADEFRMSSSTPVTPAKQQSQSQPVPARQPAVTASTNYRTVPSNGSGDAVGGLVDLLRNETESASSANPKIFKSRTYTKVSTTQPNATVDVTATPVQDSSIPKPSVSEPKVYKPTAAKSFEEKAASPNARPVETTATITKPLEAKAISTKPSETKSVEAKNVETKAVVTPKPEAVPEAKQEPEPMDDFKRRLMAAHLIPDGDDK
jgi:PadR family transcriptional regulator PadR